MRGDVRHMWTDKPCCVGSDCHLVVHLVGELVFKRYVNPFRCWFHTSVFHPIILLKETFGPLRLLGATLMCIAQTIISYPLSLFYLASTLVCIAQIILISITLVAGYQLACDVVE